MNAMEKMIMVLRDEAKKSVPTSSYGLAIMTSANTLTYNGMDFDDDEILFADFLLKKRLTTLDFEIKKNLPMDDEVHHYHKWKDDSEYIEPLKSGDVVFGILLKTDDDEKFLVLCRVV